MPKIDLTEEANLDNDFDDILKHKKLHVADISNLRNIYKFEEFALRTCQQLNTLILSGNYWYGDEVANIGSHNAVPEKLMPPRSLVWNTSTFLAIEVPYFLSGC